MTHLLTPPQEHAEPETVTYFVNGDTTTLPIKGQVQTSVVGAFPPKQVIGDFTRQSHEVLSALIQSDWIGGGQVTQSDEAIDINRYYGIATLETRFPKRLTLLPLVETVAGTGTVNPLGDLGGVFYYADGINIFSASGASVTDTGDDLTNAPVHKGVLFTGGGTTRLFVPLGPNGYDIYDGSSVSHQTSAEPVHFARWGNQLWCVQADGQIMLSTDGTTWETKLTADPANDMRGILKFYDRSDNPALILIDDQGIQALDVAAGEIWDTEFHDIPPQDDAGLAFAKWRADAFYAFGMGLFRYTFSTRNAQGLDRDNGVQAEYRGAIVDMEGTLNDLFALVRGQDVPGVGDEPDFELEGEEEYALLVAPGQTRWFLARYDGVGWHSLAVGDALGGDPSRMFFSRNGGDGGYLYWGVGNALYVTKQPTGFQNPKENPTHRFAASGRLESAKLDMGMTGSRMALAEISVSTEDCTATEKVRVYYRTDRRDWTLLGEITESGTNGSTNNYRIGGRTDFPDGTSQFVGEMFSWVQYAIEQERGDDDTTSPVVTAVAISYLKVPGTVRSWSFTVNCSVQEPGESAYGMGNQERQEFVESMVDWGKAELEDGPFFGFLHRNKWHNVRQTGCSGMDGNGLDLRGDRRVTVIEVMEEGRDAEHDEDDD